MLKNRFSVDSTHAAKMELLVKQVAAANTPAVKRALKSQATQPQSGAQGQGQQDGSSGEEVRTGCQPTFEDNNAPLDTSRVVDLATMSDTDFASTIELLGMSSTRNARKVVKIRAC